MRLLSFNSEDRRGDPPRNWRVYDFTLFGEVPESTWACMRGHLPTNANWQIPGLEAFVP